MIQMIYIFRNGMVAVFDEHGAQMPLFQGQWREVLPAILLDAPANTPIVANSDWPPTITHLMPYR